MKKWMGDYDQWRFQFHILNAENIFIFFNYKIEYKIEILSWMLLIMIDFTKQLVRGRVSVYPHTKITLFGHVILYFRVSNKGEYYEKMDAAQRDAKVNYRYLAHIAQHMHIVQSNSIKYKILLFYGAT